MILHLAMDLVLGLVPFTPIQKEPMGTNSIGKGSKNLKMRFLKI